MPTTARTVRLSIFSLGVVAAVLSCGGAAHAGEPAAQAEARAILAATGIKGGLIVHVGCGDGRLTAALRANGSYLVHGLDDAAANVEKARSHIASLRLYGKVSVAPWRGKRLPYTDNLVNLLVSADPGNVTMDEVMRVLCPNGVAYIKKDDTWTKTVKPRPTNIDEWTHYLHDASNNAVAGDTVVGPPQHLQWVGAPKWARSHDHLASISVVVSSGGRIFYIMDEGPIATVALPPKWSLVARGAFNGVPLWKRSMGPWERHLRGFRSGPAGLARRLVAVKDRVYVTLGYGKPVVALDATTGRTAKMYEGTENAREIVCQGGLLFVVVGDAAQGRRLGAARRDRWRSYSLIEPKKRLAAVSAKTGKLLWTKTGADTVDLMPTTLAVAGGRVFFQNPKEIICLDAKSGKEQWRAARPIRIGRLGWSTPTLVVYGDVVLSADRARPGPAKANAAGPGRVRWAATSKGGDAPVGELIAYSVKDGEKLWNCPCREIYNAPVDVLVAGGLVWTGNMVRANEPGITEGRDPATGEVKKRRPPDKKFFSVGMGHHRCYRNKATDRYLVLGRAGVEFIELATGTGIANHWVRGACQYGVVPCNGLLYAPSHSCACYIQGKLNGFNALAPKRKPVAAQPSDVRLERGPAYDAIRNPQSAIRNSDEWPTYRHDAARSGSTKTAVPAAVKPAWQTDVGGKLSSVVIAEGKVLVAQIDSHTVHALDAKDGTRAWSYTAGGRVDSPPTIYNGMALFGCADGYVYCLRASDGALAWRFRAAPEDRRLVAYDQVESVWPVHGSVLVQKDVVYFAAGRSSFIDGGIRLYRLDVKTGKQLSVTPINSRDPKTGLEPQRMIRGTDMMGGALPDVLSSDGTLVFMRQMKFDLEGITQRQGKPHLFSSAGFLDGSWWHRTYWIYGGRFQSGWGSWPRTASRVPAGRLLVFDPSAIYGFGRNAYATHGSHVGLGKTRYRLFAASREVPPTPAAKPGPKKRPPRRRPTRSAVKYLWSKPTPILARAMLLADKTLFIAGPVGDAQRALAAFEAKQGVALWAVSTADGSKLAECKLGSQPVFDGIAAAGGRLYISTQSGKVLCLGGAK